MCDGGDRRILTVSWQGATDRREIAMSEMLVAPVRRITPALAVVFALAVLAAVLLGFGLRAWTENTPTVAPPRVVRVEVPAPATPTAPASGAFQCRMGRAC
jgi:hypothetical protein